MLFKNTLDNIMNLLTEDEIIYIKENPIETVEIQYVQSNLYKFTRRELNNNTSDAYVSDTVTKEYIYNQILRDVTKISLGKIVENLIEIDFQKKVRV